MKKKLSGLTASGLIHSETRLGDIYLDRHGRRNTIKTVSARSIVYTRQGYLDECFCSPSRLVQDLTPKKNRLTVIGVKQTGRLIKRRSYVQRLTSVGRAENEYR